MSGHPRPPEASSSPVDATLVFFYDSMSNRQFPGSYCRILSNYHSPGRATRCQGFLSSAAPTGNPAEPNLAAAFLWNEIHPTWLNIMGALLVSEDPEAE